MPKASTNPANRNPAGREGKPISLAPHKFEDVVRKLLNTPPPKVTAKTKKKSGRKR